MAGHCTNAHTGVLIFFTRSAHRELNVTSNQEKEELMTLVRTAQGDMADTELGKIIT